TLGKAILDRHCLALDEASFFQSLAKCGYEGRALGGRAAVKESYHRHRALLRLRRERPRRRAAAERDELAPLPPITSSARVRSMGGTARPMAFAAFKLITSSSCVGNSIGSSAGVAPLKILSMYTATRRAFARRLMP